MMFNYLILLTALQILTLDGVLSVLWVCELQVQHGRSRHNSSFYVRKPHWGWLSVTAVVSCLLTSHTWLWCCMHEICMFTWFALYCEIWVFLCIHSLHLFQSGYSWPHEYMIDGLSHHPCIACKSDALDSPLENLPMNSVSTAASFSHLKVIQLQWKWVRL